MRTSATQCLAAFAVGFAAVACSSPPLGLEPAQGSGRAEASDGAGGASVASLTTVAAGGGGTVSTASALGDAAQAAPAPVVDVPIAAGGTTVTSPVTIVAQAGATGGLPTVVPTTGQDAGPDVVRAPEPDAGVVQVATDGGARIDTSSDAATRDPENADAGERSVRSCVPTRCGTHSWACWRMPNSAAPGMPNPASYTDMGDGTVRDNQTCLLWQKQAYPVGYSWADAKAKCSQNPLVEGTGWRLPTRIELISLIDFSRKDPSIVVSVFPSTQANPPHWTWSPFPAAASNSYIVSFHDGTVSVADQSAYFLARCVRGNGEDADLPTNAPVNHYQVGVDEVIDQYTGLTWQRLDSQTLSTAAVSAQSAAEYCGTLPSPQGSPAWRLPSVKELATLVDENRLGQGLPAVDLAAFPSTVAGAYWSSTRSGSQLWSVSFQDGLMSYTTTSAFARCVR